MQLLANAVVIIILYQINPVYTLNLYNMYLNKIRKNNYVMLTTTLLLCYLKNYL